ncbi:hypothetical protein A2165_03260 [Candidatus Curtissbacteria bacterium RBG_13_40_7]|uniref:Dienelactone hydrolase domain-containing protein n=1 Tax=Candidatus Curtissbacteria bacterium RBG_13_40_7 TaxID=1797706 RepID=A0A1F5FV17_9BACT|nr:MAG: hypothetical protein A2165_03260 [Candidatus Curtissbacteria bacterium RBG_13_40_7]
MKFLKRAIFINLAAILVIAVGLTFFFITPIGRPALKTMLLVPEVVPNFPIKPIHYLNKDPQVEEITLQIPQKTIKADLYRPKDNKKHPAIVFSLGTIVTRKSEEVTKFAETLSRMGFVVLVPDLPDFISGFVWTDSVDGLLSSIQFLDTQNFVDKKKMGFAAFCVGASAAIVASEDEKISNKVSFIAAIAPYFSAKEAAEAIILGKAKDSNGSWTDWQPHELSVNTIQTGYIHSVENEAERELMKGHFLTGKKMSGDEIEKLSPETRAIFDFLTNTDDAKFDEIWKRIPDDFKNDVFDYLSPDLKINKLKAKLLILNDKKDTYVPKTEGEKFVKNLPKNQLYLIEVDSFEHVNPTTKLTRLAAIKQLLNLSKYLYRIFYQAENPQN